nr:esterase, ES46.5K=46.5 kda {N-terminal} [mice, hepatic microsomes, Peptide Partial, 19 aa] [Mus sp.]
GKTISLLISVVLVAYYLYI